MICLKMLKFVLELKKRENEYEKSIILISYENFEILKNFLMIICQIIGTKSEISII